MECHPVSWVGARLRKMNFKARKKGFPLIQEKSKDIWERIKHHKFCSLCGEPYGDLDVLALHHDHEAGKVVGLAHRVCNLLEGWMKKFGDDGPTYLKRIEELWASKR